MYSGYYIMYFWYNEKKIRNRFRRIAPAVTARGYKVAFLPNSPHFGRRYT